MAVEGVTVGYCNGQVTRTGTVSVEGDTWVSAAILLTADMLAPYEGASIGSVRAGLAARTNLDEVRVWVRSTLDGDDLASGSITTETEPAIARGWNDVALATPYIIKKGEPLYVGYSYKQRAASKAISVVAGEAEGAFFLKAGSEAEWTDRSTDGLLSVEAVVTGVHVPDYDLELLAAEGRYIGQGEIEVTATIRNVGTKTIGGFTLAAVVADTQERHDQLLMKTIESGANVTATMTFRTDDETVGRQHPVDLVLESVERNAGTAADDNDENNTVRILFSYPRRVLIEEFTGEDCTNCPRAAMRLHQALYLDGYASSAVMISHHSGYYPDWLTFRPADIEYEWFFNDGNRTYAPALMADRVAQEESSQGLPTPCFDPTSAEIIETAIAYMAQRTSRAFIDLSAQIDGSQLTVSASGGRSTVFGVTPTRLTICVVEDHIEQRAQVSLETWPEFEHMGVLRAINDTWGEVIDWNDNQFSVAKTFELSSDWNRQNLRVVAFVHDYDAADPSRCEVENTAELSIQTLAGIASLPVDHAATTAVYDLQGRRVNRHGLKGLTIVSKTSAEGVRTTSKILR
ncbi:MAG: Omp28-related outer membrane protein [Prevotella sp.]|nr:Omp28-related outer membrane protein [Prevotella sp.]